MVKYKSDVYKPTIKDKDRKIRLRVTALKRKTGRFREAIAKQAMETGLEVIEKRVETGSY